VASLDKDKTQIMKVMMAEETIKLVPTLVVAMLIQEIRSCVLSSASVLLSLANKTSTEETKVSTQLHLLANVLQIQIQETNPW
jgi:hypothetical protein